MSGPAAAQLELRIHRAIPLSAAMGCRITGLEDTAITLEAPLAPNINVHGTGFAGSLYALGILAGWGLCTHLIERAGLQADLVVARASIDYLAPVTGDIRCRCATAAEDAGRFTRRLREKGRARIGVRVEIGQEPGAVIEAVMHATRR